MKPIFIAVFVCLFYVAELAAAVEQNTATPQKIIDLERVKFGLQTKTDLVGRFFKLLTSGSMEPSEKPRDKSDSGTKLLAKSFRRLNIFGLQIPREDPQRDSDGKPCNCGQEFVPDILHVKNKPELPKNEPLFSVVSPQNRHDLIQKSNELPVMNLQKYPELNLDELFQQPQGTVENQPVSFHYQTVPQSHQHQTYYTA